MASHGRRPAGLATQIVRLTLVIGLLTVVVAGTVSVGGTSKLVADRVEAHNLAALQAVEDALVRRVDAAEAVLMRVGGMVRRDRSLAVLAADVQREYETASPTVAAIGVVGPDLAPRASLPGTATVTSADARQAAKAALRGGRSVVLGSGVGLGSLWLSDTVASRSGDPWVVLLRLDTGFVDELLKRDISGAQSMFIVNGVRTLAAANDPSVDFARATWEARGPGSGGVRVSDRSGRSYSGSYNNIDGIGGLDLRLVIIQPTMSVPMDTLGTLWPTIAVVAIGGLMALVAAWMVARRVVAPLRTLETAALRAARGAYVKPIDTSRGDELGQVARAFNAVALRLNALHDMSQLLAGTSQLDQVLDGILYSIGHIVGRGVALVYLLDETGRWLIPVRARGVDASLAAAVDSLGDTWLARALTHAGPVFFEPHGRPLSEELPGVASHEGGALAAPLVSGTERLGVVVVLSETGAEFSDAEIEMVRTYSVQAALAVYNSRLFAHETESRRVAEALRLVAEKLVRPGALVDALDEVEHTIAGLFSARRASVAPLDRAALGLPVSRDREAEVTLLGFSLRVLGKSDGRRPVLVRLGDDQGADAVMKALDSRELIVVPIAIESDHGAVLVVALGDDRATRRDLELAGAVANEVALALDNAYFYEQALARAKSLETVFRISQAVGSSLEVKVVLNQVLDVVQKILSADAVALMTYDPRRKSISTEMARGGVSQAIVDRIFQPGDDVVGHVFAAGEPMILRDLRRGMEGLSGDAAGAGLGSMLAVPLRARGRSIGVLTVFSRDAGAFTDDDVSMLQTFASQAALAIDTARLYSREHEVASLLQDSILPGALPAFEGIDAASAYEPAGGDSEIGGDYYDMFRAPDGSVWLAIADVCGKGVAAAAKTSMIKYAVRSLVVAGFTPGRVLTEVNRMVAEGDDPTSIVTLWAGRIDLVAGTMTWSSGGHPPGMLRRAADGAVVRLAATGPLLGAVADVAFGEEASPFVTGDVAVLYTDGVTEARSGNRFFGESRVEDALAPGGTASEVVERLQASVRRFVQAELRDDVAVLCVRLIGAGA